MEIIYDKNKNLNVHFHILGHIYYEREGETSKALAMIGAC